MLKHIFIMLLLLASSCRPAIAQQVDARDVLPNLDTAESTAIVNNQLRLNQNAINAIGGYFNSNGYLQPSSGGTGTNISTFPNGALLVYNSSNVGIGTFGQAASGLFVQSQGIGSNPTWATPTDTNQSNVLFQYAGQVDQTGAAVGEVVGTTLVPNGATGNYRFLQSTGGLMGSYTTIATYKFIKTAGISTVTVWARIWVRSGASSQANIKVDIGGQNGNVSGTAGQFTPEWKSFTINVSSLTNNTSYDVTVSMQDISGNSETRYCSNIIAFGS